MNPCRNPTEDEQVAGVVISESLGLGLPSPLLALHEQSPKLTYSFFGIPFRALHLPFDVQAS